METIMKENEFAKINSQEEYLVCLTKSRFLKFGYYWYFFSRIFSSTGVEVAIPVKEIKKMTIQSMSIASIVFFIFAAMSFGLGFLNDKDQFTGETIPASGSHITTGIIIGVILLACGFLYLRSKTGRLKVMHTYYKGTPVVVYASLDISELKTLRELIEKNKKM